MDLCKLGDKKVAVKRLHDRLLTSPSDLSDFHREASLLCTLEHK